MSLSISTSRSPWPVGLGVTPPQTHDARPKPQAKSEVHAAIGSVKAEVRHVYARPAEKTTVSSDAAAAGTDAVTAAAPAPRDTAQHREAARISADAASARSALRAWLSDSGTAKADAAWVNSVPDQDQSTQDPAIVAANAAYAMIAGAGGSVQTQASSVRRSA